MIKQTICIYVASIVFLVLLFLPFCKSHDNFIEIPNMAFPINGKPICEDETLQLSWNAIPNSVNNYDVWIDHQRMQQILQPNPAVIAGNPIQINSNNFALAPGFHTYFIRANNDFQYLGSQLGISCVYPRSIVTNVQVCPVIQPGTPRAFDIVWTFNNNLIKRIEFFKYCAPSLNIRIEDTGILNNPINDCSNVIDLTTGNIDSFGGTNIFQYPCQITDTQLRCRTNTDLLNSTPYQCISSGSGLYSNFHVSSNIYNSCSISESELFTSIDFVDINYPALVNQIPRVLKPHDGGATPSDGCPSFLWQISTDGICTFQDGDGVTFIDEFLINSTNFQLQVATDKNIDNIVVNTKINPIQDSYWYTPYLEYKLDPSLALDVNTCYFWRMGIADPCSNNVLAGWTPPRLLVRSCSLIQEGQLSWQQITLPSGLSFNESIRAIRDPINPDSFLVIDNLEAANPRVTQLTFQVSPSIQITGANSQNIGAPTVNTTGLKNYIGVPSNGLILQVDNNVWVNLIDPNNLGFSPLTNYYHLILSPTDRPKDTLYFQNIPSGFVTVYGDHTGLIYLFGGWYGSVGNTTVNDSWSYSALLNDFRRIVPANNLESNSRANAAGTFNKHTGQITICGGQSREWDVHGARWLADIVRKDDDCERYDTTFNVYLFLERLPSGPVGTSVENHDLIYIDPCHIMTLASTNVATLRTNFTSIYRVDYNLNPYDSPVIPAPPFTIGNSTQLPLGYANGASFYDPKNGLLFHFVAGNVVWVLSGFVPICPNGFNY